MQEFPQYDVYNPLKYIPSLPLAIVATVCYALTSLAVLLLMLKWGQRFMLQVPSPNSPTRPYRPTTERGSSPAAFSLLQRHRFKHEVQAKTKLTSSPLVLFLPCSALLLNRTIIIGSICYSFGMAVRLWFRYVRLASCMPGPRASLSLLRPGRSRPKLPVLIPSPVSPFFFQGRYGTDKPYQSSVTSSTARELLLTPFLACIPLFDQHKGSSGTCALSFFFVDPISQHVERRTDLFFVHTSLRHPVPLYDPESMCAPRVRLRSPRPDSPASRHG
jgi:hypothetical protein